MVFIVATSVMIGRVPDAVRGGVGSTEWVSLVLAFVIAASAFVAQQIVAPLQAALGELLARRVDGHVFDRLISASLRSTGIGPLEDQSLLDDLTQAATTLEQSFRTPGLACAGLLALVARYTQLLGCAAVVGLVFAWPAALALIAATMVFRKGKRGGLRDVRPALRPDDRHVAREPATSADVAMRAGGRQGDPRLRPGRLADATDIATCRWSILDAIWAERRRIYLRPYLRYTAFGFVVAAVVLAAVGRRGCERRDLADPARAGPPGCHWPPSDWARHSRSRTPQTQFGMLAYDGVQGFERGVAAFAREDDPARTAPGPGRPAAARDPFRGRGLPLPRIRTAGPRPPRA